MKHLKHLRLFSILIILFSFFGCNSSDDDINPENPNQTCKISKITYGFGSGNETFDVIYNNGNISQFLSSSSKVIFSYNSNQLTTREIINLSNNQTEFKSEFVSTNGKITEERTYEYYSGALNYTGKDTFEYSGNNLTLIQHYDSNNAYSGKTVINWTNNNPTSTSFYDENNVLECTITLNHDNTQVNKFNAEFTLFLFQDIFDEDFSKYLFLGNNNLTSTTNSCSGNTTNYTITNNSNGYTSEIKQGTNSLYKFEYSCQ